MPRIYPFHVMPSLPERLKALDELSLNLRWCWDHPTIELFRSIDADLWERTRHNPRLMLGQIDQRRLDELAEDEAFLAQLDRAWGNLEEYMAGIGWFVRNHLDDAPAIIAYFSAEFGLTECIPIYAGGLGLLAGDHLKSASDLGLPLTGVGLLYQGGYFHQYLNSDGWQQETYPINDFHALPIQDVKDDAGAPVTVGVEFPGRTVVARVWKVQVGRIPLYLLDTNVPSNSSDDRRITGALYGGDKELRMQQEIVLGIGGLRALKAVGITPTVCHMNEGHSAFLGPERTRMLMEQYDMAYYEARQIAAAGNIFTTHTPVEAGFDRFDTWMMEKYFHAYADKLGVGLEQFLSFGRQNAQDHNESFNMAFLAARHSSYANGVSKLHGEVTRKMARPVWSGYPMEEIPIGSVTNGIHARTWTSMEMTRLLERYLGPRWAEEPPESKVWERIDSIPDQELWRVHEIRRERLVNFARMRLTKQLQQRGSSDLELSQAPGVLNPDVLTIGFARRFATYKRATLVLSDPDRLKRILTDQKKPVQLLFAGKAHPHDDEGKKLIRAIINFIRDAGVRNHVVFLEDYDISTARYLVQGCDVWLNTPLRPNEASGTSGMKLLPNGGINFSILDGWWAECYEPGVGWAIGKGEDYADAGYRDRVESQALYNTLENDIVPLYYDRDENDVPRRWIARMKASMKVLTPQFNTNRMVAEYTERFYLPAHKRHLKLSENNGRAVMPLVEWRRRIRANSSSVRVTNLSCEHAGALTVGAKLPVEARVSLGEIRPTDVRVELYYGRVNSEGQFVSGEKTPMMLAESHGTEHVYRSTLACNDSGSCGLSVRIVPEHKDAILPYEMPWIVWAE